MSEASKQKAEKVCHCPSCGTISINQGLSRAYACPECQQVIGAKGTGDAVPLVASGVSLEKPVKANLPSEKQEVKEEGEQRSELPSARKGAKGANRKRRKHQEAQGSGWKAPLVLLGVFFLMVGLGTAFFWNKMEQKEVKLRESLDFVRNNPEGMAEERARLVEALRKKTVEDQLPKMGNTLLSFFKNKDTEGRWQYVYESHRQAGVMAEYYERGFPSGAGKSKDLRLVYWDLIKLKERDLVTTIWETSNGRFGAVFVETGLGWKLDWRFIERYSAGSWVLFFSDVGAATEGEFRTYLRLRAVQNAGKWDVSVHRPNDYLGTYDSEPAASLSVDKESEAGKKLTLLFEDEEALGGRTFFKKHDKENCYRARIVLGKETNAEGEVEIKLKDVLAANWLDEQLQSEPEEEESGTPANAEESTVEEEPAKAADPAE